MCILSLLHAVMNCFLREYIKRDSESLKEVLAEMGINDEDLINDFES